MNPYARFGLVSNSVSAAIIIGSLAVFGLPVFDAITSTAGTGPAMWAAMAGAVTVLVVFWLAMTETIFPTLFRFNSVRKLVLGKYYIEGTWLQAERGGDAERMAVIDVQPDGKDFIFSGYALNADLEIESNTLIELSKFEWPFMVYKYRNSLSDGSDGKREGVGEIQFEMNRDSARRYNGYLQHLKDDVRLKIEGAKLTSNSEVKRLRSLEGRQKIYQKYWDLFFNSSVRANEVADSATVVAKAPVIEAAPKAEAPVVERRKAESKPSEEAVVPRRRSSDWRQDPPKAETKSKAKKTAEPDTDDLRVEDVFEDFDVEDDAATGTDASTGASSYRSRRNRRR